MMFDNVIPLHRDQPDDQHYSQDEDLPRVAPGEYVVTYVRHEKVRIFGKPGRLTPKVRVDFRLEAYPELIIPRWYRVASFDGGRIRAGKNSDIVRELSAALGKRMRCDQVHVRDLKNVRIVASVRDVVADHRQRSLAPINRYSVIDRLTGIPA